MNGTYTKCPHKEDLNTLTAIFQTNLGTFETELYPEKCPETVWNFVNLAEGRQEGVKTGPFYDGLIFHRIIDGFVIQGGCPDGTGMGGPGYRFNNECRQDLPHDEGVLSMANTGRDGTNGSQFFITLAPTPLLNGKHTVWGRVVKGMDVVKKIGKVAVGMHDRPLEDVIIEKVSIVRP